MLCFSSLSRFVNVTAASLLTAPLASVTVPVIVPYTFWPHPADGVSTRMTVAASNASPRVLRFVIVSSPRSQETRRTDTTSSDDAFPVQNDETSLDTGNLVGPYVDPTKHKCQEQFRYSYEMNQENESSGGL